jgi:hypothetical protein
MRTILWHRLIKWGVTTSLECLGVHISSNEEARTSSELMNKWGYKCTTDKFNVIFPVNFFNICFKIEICCWLMAWLGGELVVIWKSNQLVLTIQDKNTCMVNAYTRNIKEWRSDSSNLRSHTRICRQKDRVQLIRFKSVSWIAIWSIPRDLIGQIRFPRVP